MHGARDYEKRDQMAVYKFDETSGLVADDAATYTDHDCDLTNLSDSAWVLGYVGSAFEPYRRMETWFRRTRTAPLVSI